MNFMCTYWQTEKSGGWVAAACAFYDVTVVVPVAGVTSFPSMSVACIS